MDAPALHGELAELEQRYWKAIADKDVDACNALNAERMVVTGPSGVSTIDRETFGKMLKTGKWKLESFSFSDLRVEELGPDAAVVAYKVHEELEVEGKRISLDAADSSVWVKSDGGWRCAVHTEALRGDPFGRDRKT
ncbi:MAG TPA: nuclear transport factor 2 family protein [Labilithrix sp.]